jgi:hypothetical protein
MALVNGSRICTTLAPTLNEELSQSAKTTLFSTGRTGGWYLGFVRLGSSKELGMQRAFCRLTSVS